MTQEALAPSLEPRLIVRDADAAISFYENAIGATCLERFTDSSGRVVHAALQIGGSRFTMAEEVLNWGLAAPDQPAGASVLMHLTLPDPDGAATRMQELGAEIVISIEDRPYGRREGRVRDPFGHAWILSREIETLTAEEIQARLGV